jgi:ATP phosphoribosyltransferase
MAEALRLVMAKGKIFDDAKNLMLRAGFNVDSINDGRQMIFEVPEENLRVMVVRPTDVPVYVEHGAADLGITGKDILLEEGRDVYELLDLKLSPCHFGLAAPVDDENVLDKQFIRIASKFPRVSQRFFADRGQQAEVIKLHGAVEIAPMVGLADAIVDIVSSGRTLKENNMKEIAFIADITARLVANRVSYRTRLEEIIAFEKRLKAVIA